jgi:hypothetical protein
MPMLDAILGDGPGAQKREEKALNGMSREEYRSQSRAMSSAGGK